MVYLAQGGFSPFIFPFHKLEELCVRPDHRERSLQLVACIGDELALPFGISDFRLNRPVREKADDRESEQEQAETDDHRDVEDTEIGPDLCSAVHIDDDRGSVAVPIVFIIESA